MTDAAGSNRLLQLLPGRSIAFSPEWRDDGLSVLFDRNSGDYWVVSALARRLIELLAEGEQRSEEELARLASEEALSGPNEELPTPRAVLAELMQLGLLISAAPPGSAGGTYLA